MNTPIWDFVQRYNASAPLRLHMPGHKGASLLGFEGYDITEIPGADSLYETDGIIRESEQNASRLFGCPTLYSTEGSSHAIRAMLYLALLCTKEAGRTRPKLLAGRNAHKALLSAAALLDMPLIWLYPEAPASYLACPITAADVEAALTADPDIAALYLTSPDYLGHILPLADISAVCHRHGVLLLVDNAHGAYLRFLSPSRHPMDAGADLSCDSAHKTLPVLTGGAYLHISPSVPALCTRMAKAALALFGSTSPSYITLSSLDRANAYLAEGYASCLATFAQAVDKLKSALSAQGFCLVGDECLKLTVAPKSYGYTGAELADCLATRGIICEFCDPDHLVLMLTPEVGDEGLARLEAALVALPRRPTIKDLPPPPHHPAVACSVRQAMLTPAVAVPIEQADGRILAAATLACPPAVPIVVCGERIDRAAIRAFDYYGIRECLVLQE